jgi:hypothetical protein
MSLLLDKTGHAFSLKHNENQKCFDPKKISENPPPQIAAIRVISVPIPPYQPRV